jgi:thiamine-phosphate pyrophosphorylase
MATLQRRVVGIVILSAITNQKRLGGELLAFVAEALRAGVDWLQIREKDLSGRDLLELCQAVSRLPNPHQTRLIVNGRPDVAIAAGLDGIHLPASAAPLGEVRRLLGPDLMIGVSCHSLTDLEVAEREGADYAYYSPIFASMSKPGYGPAMGLGNLEIACRAVQIPVLALGGVTTQNADACLQAGAAGVAGISLFQGSTDLCGLVRELKAR